MTSLSHKIAWNTSVQIGGKVASTGLGLLITVLLTRYLGREAYGTFIFAGVFVSLFWSLADWGLTLITVREASKKADQAAEIIGNTLVIRLILAVIAAVAAVLAIYLLPYSPQIRFLVILNSLTAIALSLKTSFQIIFNVKLQMQNWAVSEFSANVLITLLTVLAIYLRLGIEAFVWAYIAGDFLAAFVAAFLAYKLLPLRYSLVRSSTKYLIAEAIPMGAILVTFTVYNRIDTVILSLFKGQEAVALYALAYRVYEVLVLGAAYFANTILPIISTLAHSDKNKLGEVYRRSFIVLFFMGLVAAVGALIFAPLAVAIMGGPQFAAAVTPLRILALALIVSYFNHINGFTIIALGKQWYSLMIAVVALSFNIILNLLFIPRWSYNAAAFITFLTEGLIVLLSILVIHKELGVRPYLGDVALVIKEFISKRGKIFENV